MSELRRFRILMVLGLLLYPGWYYVFTYLIANAHDDLIGRFALGGICAIVLGLTYTSQWIRNHIPLCLYTVIYLMAAHYFWLVYVNQLHIAYVEGSFVVVLALSVIILSRLGLVLFSAFIMAATLVVVSSVHSDLPKVMLPFGLGTTLFVTYVSLGFRLRLIEALAASEDSLRGLFNSTFEGIALHDNGIVVDANEACARIFGYEREELSGKNLKVVDLIAPESRESVLSSLYTQEARRYEVTGLRKDGTRFALEIERKPYTYQGRRVILTALRDTTERKEMEVRLRLSDRLASIGTLAAGVGHEINNPLFLVLGNLEFCLERLHQLKGESVPEIVDELSPLLEGAVKGAERVKVIVRDLKFLSRQDEETLGPVDVMQLIDSAAAMANNEVKHRAKLVKDIAPVPRVYGNEARLGQVILNLIVNAAQAIVEGHRDENEIRVATRLMPDNRILISVSDTGKGMTPDVMARIFDPFFTTKEIGVGTGLGLTICHKIVTGLGGEITVNSTPGKGTTFRVLLPAARADEKASPVVKAVKEASGDRKRLLVIDDEIDICKLVQTVLGREHDIVVAPSGKEALALLEREKPFDVVLCDVMMPDTTGMDVYEEISRRFPGLEQRIIFMTGGVFTQRSKEFLKKVPNYCMEKPLQFPQLRKLIRHLAAGGSSGGDALAA